MQSQVISPILGYVKAELIGGEIESFLNLAAARRIALWDIVRSDKQKAVLHMTVRDFFRVKPILKKTGCRIRVKERKGLPFVLDRLGRRKFFIGGMAVFAIGLYLLSSLVWQIRVEGNHKLKAADILDAAAAVGIREMQWKFRLPDADTLSRGIQSRLVGVSWVGVRFEGTLLTIQVVESARPEAKPLQSPRSLVAAKNALITEISTEKGRPMVQPNTYVRKGDVLISGWVGSDTNGKSVVSEGKVLGLVWYTTRIEIPLKQVHKEYTGESYRKFYLVFGNRALQVTGYGRKPYALSETVPERKAVQLGKFRLPFGWMKERVFEATLDERLLDAKEAENDGLARARSSLLREAGEDSRVVSEKVLSRKTEDGYLKLEALIETEERITEEQPVVPPAALPEAPAQ